MLRVLLLTGLAMLAFAANSFLRGGLGAGDDRRMELYRRAPAGRSNDLGDPRNDRLARTADVHRWSWPGAAALFGNALAFSLACLLLSAGMGALILFASVQFAMLTWAIVRGDRPGPWNGWGSPLPFRLSLTSSLRGSSRRIRQAPH